MLNMIRMDLYRMFHSKSLYVVWVIMIAAMIWSVKICKSDYDNMQRAAQENNGVIEQQDEGDGMGVYLAMVARAGESATLGDLAYANIHGRLLGVFLAVFAVIFSTADLDSGFIKNVGGQVTNRAMLNLSKAVVLLIFTVLSMALFAISIMAGSFLSFGYVEWGGFADFCKYIGVELLLHYAMVLVCMVIAVIVKNNIFSMVAAIILVCMRLELSVWGLLDKFLALFGVSDFYMGNYLITTHIMRLPTVYDSKAYVNAVAVSVVFGVIAVVLGSVVFKKRDI